MKRLKIAQIGIGHDHAADTFTRLCRQTDNFEVVGYCPVADEGERPLPACYEKYPRLTVEEVFSMPTLDAVTIETDDWNLTEYAQLAAERGLAIHMDKPGAESQEAFETLARSVKKNHCVFQLGYMYRYNTMIADVIRAARAGEYGEIFSVEAHMDCEHPAAKRQWLAHFKGGMLYFLGCHLIDLIVQAQGIPEEIIPLSTCSGFDGVTGNDIGMTVFKYKNGVSFAKTTACEPGGYMRRQLVVSGQNRTVMLMPLEEYAEGELQTTRMRDCYPGNGWSYDGVRSAKPAADRYDAMMADFAAMARGEKENPYTLEYECQLHKIILAACGFDIDYRSAVVL